MSKIPSYETTPQDTHAIFSCTGTHIIGKYLVHITCKQELTVKNNKKSVHGSLRLVKTWLHMELGDFCSLVPRPHPPTTFLAGRRARAGHGTSDSYAGDAI